MADGILIHWFRNDLRLQDIPALNDAMKKCSTLYPVYIFNKNEIEQKKVAYNRVRFILESLQNIDKTLQLYGGRLYVFCGEPLKILHLLIKKWHITHVSYEDDIQPSWRETENCVHQLCKEMNVEIIKKVSHTLWDPRDVLKANRGQPPVTYSVFCQVVAYLGPPLKPEPTLNFENISIANEEVSDSNLPLIPEDLNVIMDCPEQRNKVWTGGETHALQHLEYRLKIEKEAIDMGILMPNQAQPDLLGPPVSMSAALSMGCLSVRKFYWDLFNLHTSHDPNYCDQDGFIGQLIWREYFYTMCMNNPYFDKMLENPICLTIDWISDDEKLKCWIEGKTGFPFIDAAMRQLRQEGWIHHVARNAVACFLTRGDLWISWEEGFKVFMKYLLDADFAVCAGNWMWVSSSAFENILQCSSCISPITYGRRFDRSGKYIRKYIPELQKMSTQYIFEPWLAPLSEQKSAGCVIGEDYPNPIVDHDIAAAINKKKMNGVQASFLNQSVPLHCTPSSIAETRFFMCLPDTCLEN